ncbi:MAG: hypothetical protein HYW88_01320 [Candidatus Sungbacteria bacterium]|nr:hypothetical protein [Candidatus Sungbacteria bacterium]
MIPQIWVRRAELYLTISRGEVDEKTYQYYGRLACDALTAAIEAEAYANIPHYSYLGGKKFGYAGDTVGSVALYMRATFFSKTRAKDLEELKTKFPDSPSTVKALRELQSAR